MNSENRTPEIGEMMSKVYDHYFSSAAYERRYPMPNRATLDYIYNQGAATAGSILDFGCGNGRYAMALLHACHARITGCDISAASLDEFGKRLRSSGWAPRVELIHGSVEALGPKRRYDLIIMMFGVLAHVGKRHERIRVLKALRAMLGPGGRLVLSVPNLYRRRPGELLKSLATRRLLRETSDERKESGDIYFTRSIAGRSLTFFYHLYSVPGLCAELEAAGFRVVDCRAESLLPEWLVTQYPSIAALESLLLPLLPVTLGYGICASAIAAQP